MDQLILPGVYRHYKGKLYEVLGAACHSETEEKFVVYKTCYGKRSTWVRPLDIFADSVSVNGQSVPRFEYIGETDTSVDSDE